MPASSTTTAALAAILAIRAILGTPATRVGGGDLQIVRAYYGLNNRTNDVTQLLRGRVQNSSLVIQAITTTWAAILRSAETRC
jgi:hypothetical protein